MTVEVANLPEARRKWDWGEASRVAYRLCAELDPHCDRSIVAGSIRRGKPRVGDIEILYIPKCEWRPMQVDLFTEQRINLADEAISVLERDGILERRRNAKGSEVFGPKNKLMRHVETGIPVDLFAATDENWFNYLVCRTGPAESNIRIASEARRRGWKWNPYGRGFSRGGPLAGPSGEFVVQSERDVFEFVGLPYLEPSER